MRLNFFSFGIIRLFSIDLVVLELNSCLVDLWFLLGFLLLVSLLGISEKNDEADEIGSECKGCESVGTWMTIGDWDWDVKAPKLTRYPHYLQKNK